MHAPMKRLSLLAMLMAACAPTHTPRADATPFVNYVAMGDSITGGTQSAGVTAASQQAAYPVLLGQRAGLKVVMPELPDGVGCPPPIGSALRFDCTRRNPLLKTSNVAVPGAKLHDVLYTTDTQVSDPDPQLYDPRIYRLVLGPGTTQIDAALARKPDFVTLWIGNNDVLLPTLRGRPDQATPLAQFRADYATLLDRLLSAGIPHIVVMTVANVTQVPALVPVRTLRLAGLVDASCVGQEVYFGTVVIAQASKANPLSCTAPEALSAAEYQQAQATVDGYNEAIRELAGANGVPVLDVNAVLATLPGRPLIPSQQEPFGRTFSLDGVHPSSVAHRRFAQVLAAFLNEHFGTDLDTRP